MKSGPPSKRDLFARFYLSAIISYQLSKFPINKARGWMRLKDVFPLFRTRIISKCVSGIARERWQASRNQELSLMAWQSVRLAAWNSLRNSPGLLEAKAGKAERQNAWSQMDVAVLPSTPFSLSPQTTFIESSHWSWSSEPWRHRLGSWAAGVLGLSGFSVYLLPRSCRNKPARLPQPAGEPYIMGRWTWFW